MTHTQKIARKYRMSEEDAEITLHMLNRLLGALMGMGIKIDLQDLFSVDYNRDKLNNQIIGRNKRLIRAALNNKNKIYFYLNEKNLYV